ncbi:hypothetical protein SEVIR_2G013500v4 [Setaria viridis]|uniref:Uncharacterized protein n=1 Tax=Setaria viridis TaxID=4556 RepID=A0A4U6VN50_SETVI|nr:uncharacterized protein LOC117842601 [Setaria viridis]TKW30114.1 hypothetical protein SEVIR_2G013500v2 [Setaria viridis]
MAPPPSPQPPELMEELVEEILLHFPPHEPALLVRAALVCKHWCRLISGPGFRRRFRELHRTPPMLGFHYRGISDDGRNVGRFVPTAAFRSPRAESRSWRALGARHGRNVGRFVPTAAFRSPRAAESRSWRALDARHGRVLLRCPGEPFGTDIVLAVWDPITDEKRKLPLLPRNRSRWGAAILCSAAGACDHLDCHRGPFLVVFVGSNLGGTCICTYSSDAAAWSQAISTPGTGDCVDPLMRSALIGNALYFGLVKKTKALRYDLESREMSWVQLPPTYHNFELRVLTTTEDDGLGLVTAHSNKIYMWSRKAGPPNTGWTQDRVIELERLLPIDAVLASPDVVGFAEGIGVVFVTANNVLFTIDLKTCKVKKVCEGRGIRGVVPYMSFYTPALGAACTAEGPSAGGSSA